MDTGHPNRRHLNLPLLLAALVTMLVALWAGLQRLGWSLPGLQPSQVAAHGALMVSGFLGTLIALERAVAIRKPWAYAGPALSALGAILLLLGAPHVLGAGLFSLSSLCLVLVFAVMLRRYPKLDMAVMAGGAGAWLVGSLLWLGGWPIYRLVLWWAAFLILTIAGERLELSRLVRLSPGQKKGFTAAVGLFAAGLVVTTIAFDPGVRLAGLGMLALTIWLLRFDIARRTVRKAGLPRFAAICMLLGYAWMGVAGGLAVIYGAVYAGPLYDALLHAIFLGFVFSMIFGHAPIIFPAVLGRQVRFSTSFYLHLALLHASLLLRVAGDLTGSPTARLYGGMLNAIAILFFLANTGRTLLAQPSIQGTETYPARGGTEAA